MIVADAAVMTVVVVAAVIAVVTIVADAVVMTAPQVIVHPLIARQTTGAVSLLP